MSLYLGDRLQPAH